MMEMEILRTRLHFKCDLARLENLAFQITALSARNLREVDRYDGGEESMVEERSWSFRDVERANRV